MAGTKAEDYTTVANSDEIKPGERMVVEFGRCWVAIFNVDGVYYAIEDVCTHDDGPLAEGELNDCIITCPRHGATFDIRTGKVLSPPAMLDVKSFEVRLEGSAVQIRARR